MSEKFKIQVPKEHYSEHYDGLSRFISYFYQIDIVRKLKPKKVLEIGIGNKTVANYLKQNGIKIDTCDFDKELHPDFVADVRDLPFKNNAYDVVMACEIIEHIPWKDVDKALNEIHRISKKYVVISIPYSSTSVEVIIKIPLIKNIIKNPFINFFFRIPHFLKTRKFSGEHYWEMGEKNFSIKKIRSEFKKRFKILDEVRPMISSYQHFFILEKK